MDLKVYDLGVELLNELMVSLATTRGGAPTIAAFHPGNQVPFEGCPLAAVRTVNVIPIAARAPNCPPEFSVTYEMTVDRCYPITNRGEMAAIPRLDSATRDLLEDGGAMRRAAMCADWGRDARRTLGTWTPRGPSGAMYGGAMQVTATGVTLVCACNGEWSGIDTRYTPLPGDPRGT